MLFPLHSKHLRLGEPNREFSLAVKVPPAKLHTCMSFQGCLAHCGLLHSRTLFTDDLKTVNFLTRGRTSDLFPQQMLALQWTIFNLKIRGIHSSRNNHRKMRQRVQLAFRFLDRPNSWPTTSPILSFRYLTSRLPISSKKEVLLGLRHSWLSVSKEVVTRRTWVVVFGIGQRTWASHRVRVWSWW